MKNSFLGQMSKTKGSELGEFRIQPSTANVTANAQDFDIRHWPLEVASPAIRVLHVHAGNMFGGVETMLLTQVRQRNLCPGMEMTFALCFEGRFGEELTKADGVVHSLGAVRVRQPLSVRRGRRNLRELLRREVFDVVVTHSCWSQAIFGQVVRTETLPLVFYTHGRASGKHWLERWARGILPDMLLCNSQFTAATSSLLYPEVPAVTLYCPVAPPRRGSESERSETRSQLQTPQDATVIIQVGRLERLKGHHSQLEALSLL